MRVTVLPLLLSVLLGALAGCSSSSGTGTGSSTPTGTDDTAAAGGTDTGALDTNGALADASDVATPPAPECTTNADCGATEVCDCAQQCVAGGVAALPACVEDKNCGSANYCDPCARVCRPLRGLCDQCVTDAECLDGGSCVDFASGGRFCLRECLSDIGCPAPAFKCKALDGAETKQCQPQTGVCALKGECEKDLDCEFGQVCNQGLCGAGCTADTSCPDGQVCSAFRCGAACTEQNPCTGGLICVEGHCKVEGGCLDATECPAVETYCDPVAKMCTPGCLQDFDCKSAKKECQNGKCVDRGCTGNFFCAFEQVCNLASGKCEAAVGPYCEAGCDPESETACGGDPNKCIKLQDKDGNDVGAFCFVGCAFGTQNACPQGYACQQLKDDKGVVQAELCWRDCTKKPLGVE